MVRMDCALVLPSRAEVPARPDCLHACCSAWLGARTNGLYFISPCLPDVSRGHSKRWKWAMSASGNLWGWKEVCQLCRPSPQSAAEKPDPPSSTTRVPGGQDLNATRLGSLEKTVMKRNLSCTHPKRRAGWWWDRGRSQGLSRCSRATAAEEVLEAWMILRKQPVGGCGEKETLKRCWWECKLVQPLWKMVGFQQKN